MELLFHLEHATYPSLSTECPARNQTRTFGSPILFYAFVTEQQNGPTVILGALHKRGSLASDI
jgi:hypothetical protein